MAGLAQMHLMQNHMPLGAGCKQCSISYCSLGARAWQFLISAAGRDTSFKDWQVGGIQLCNGQQYICSTV